MRCRVGALGAVLVAGMAGALCAPSAQGATTPVEECLQTASDEPRTNYDARRTGDTIEITEYLPAGSYRASTCGLAGTLIRSVTAEPHRLPDGKLAWLPHRQRINTQRGVNEIVADYGDLRLYEGNWRAAVREATEAVPQPASPHKVTEPRLPKSTPGPPPRSEGDPLKLELKAGKQPSAPPARSMLDPRCGYGSYAFSYYHKTAAVHEINLSPIGIEHHPAFIENINQGFNTWQYTYNICGFTPVNGVTAATSGYTQVPAGINDGLEIVDAGPLTTGTCAGALACAYIWPDLKHDVRLSTAYPYCVGWCAGHYDIWSVVSHEAGHVYGFGHDSTPGMVMYAYISPNDASNRYLWWGDYLGLSSQY